MRTADIYARVTQQIITAIETGAATGTYRMPWHNWGEQSIRPINAATGRAYRGINTLLLWAAAEAGAYSSGRWATYRQWAEAGAQVRKGEKSTFIIFWKNSTGTGPAADNDDADTTTAQGRFVARAFHVFNEDQVDGAPAGPQQVETGDLTVAAAAQFICRTGIQIRHGGDQACYVPSIDQVWLPQPGQFRDTEGYYATLAHEAIHWTGAKHRLDRGFSDRFGDEAYAVEELVAELGAAFLTADLHLRPEPRPDHARYIASWLKVLKNDPKAILSAAAKAQQAVDYLNQFSSASAAQPVSFPAPAQARRD
ncbi:MAG: ssDNA-binding domain-containing protein [Mycobacteriaceae bacterium]|nr:ssDNA-binding domain-containing protein [Mycobacteriaceae bacterium]